MYYIYVISLVSKVNIFSNDWRLFYIIMANAIMQNSIQLKKICFHHCYADVAKV